MNRKDLFRNMFIASAASIPYVGTAISNYLEKKIPEYICQQYDSFISEIEQDIKTIEAKLDYTRFDTPEFFSLFQITLNEVVFAYQDETRRMYKNMIINSITNDSNWNKRDFFLYLTSHFSKDAIEELLLIYSDRADNIGIMQIAHRFPEHNDYIFSFGSELTRYRLVDGNKLTSLGKEYCDFVFQPILPRIIL